jgi:restriction system protein
VQAIGSYYSMSAREFEEAIAWLCRRDGCTEAHVTGKAGDLGADVRAITPDGRILIVQAKRQHQGLKGLASMSL